MGFIFPKLGVCKHGENQQFVWNHHLLAIPLQKKVNHKYYNIIFYATDSISFPGSLEEEEEELHCSQKYVKPPRRFTLAYTPTWNSIPTQPFFNGWMICFFSKNRGTPKWMICNGKGWFGGTPILGNTHVESSDKQHHFLIRGWPSGSRRDWPQNAVCYPRMYSYFSAILTRVQR